MVHSQSKGKIVDTSMTTAKGSSTQQQQQRDVVMTEHRNNFSSRTGVPQKFQVGDKVWLHLQKERLTRAHQKLRPLRHGPYTSTKATKHITPPFLRLPQVFNVDHHRPCFPPFLDTSEIVEQLTRDPDQRKLPHLREELNAMGTIAS